MDSPHSALIIQVNDDDFEREVIVRSHEKTVIVDFWAPWCQPCLMLAPLLEQLIGERPSEFVLAKVNIDEAPNLAAAHGIDSIPAVKAFREGKAVLEFVGLLPESELRLFLQRAGPTEAGRLVRQAAEHEVSDPIEAEAQYRRALVSEPNHEGAIVGLARLRLTCGDEVEASELLERIGPGGEHSAESERLGACLFLQRLARELGDEASARKRHETEPANAQARYALGCLQAAAGQYRQALQLLLGAAEADRSLAVERVREVMVKIFQAVGVRSPLADEYRDKLARILY